MYFSQPVIVPSNYSSIDNQVLDIAIIPSGLVALSRLYYTWYITDFTNNYMHIQLHF